MLLFLLAVCTGSTDSVTCPLTELVKDEYGLEQVTIKPCNTCQPLCSHVALKHHFTSPKTDLIFLQQRVL